MKLPLLRSTLFWAALWAVYAFRWGGWKVVVLHVPVLLLLAVVDEQVTNWWHRRRDRKRQEEEMWRHFHVAYWSSK